MLPQFCIEPFSILVDFQRAVKACTGQNLNSHLVHVVFQLFDKDGDGKLSHREFIAVMKERLHRGARVSVFAHLIWWRVLKRVHDVFTGRYVNDSSWQN